MVNDVPATPPSYEVVSIQRAKPAPDEDGANWHSYVISYEGKESIYGCRQGDLETVTMATEEIVARLNERHRGRFRKTGRVQLTLTSNKKT